MKKSDIQIFLAHASEDKKEIIKLYNLLKQAGYAPWLDEKNLIPGQVWEDEILKAIRESQIFLACLSSRAVTKRGYIQKELKIAKEDVEVALFNGEVMGMLLEKMPRLSREFSELMRNRRNATAQISDK